MAFEVVDVCFAFPSWHSSSVQNFFCAKSEECRWVSTDSFAGIHRGGDGNGNTIGIRIFDDETGKIWNIFVEC
jgi:hypothetical protein